MSDDSETVVSESYETAFFMFVIRSVVLTLEIAKSLKRDSKTRDI
jgi:hypothetical protein